MATSKAKLIVYLMNEEGGPDIQVHLDQVIICGHVVMRPSRIPRSVWIAYWEKHSWIEGPKR